MNNNLCCTLPYQHDFYHYLGNKTNGFYIECGAADGEEGSNTLYFEIRRDWRGNN